MFENDKVILQEILPRGVTFLQFLAAQYLRLELAFKNLGNSSQGTDARQRESYNCCSSPAAILNSGGALTSTVASPAVINAPAVRASSSLSSRTIASPI